MMMVIIPSIIINIMTPRNIGIWTKGNTYLVSIMLGILYTLFCYANNVQTHPYDKNFKEYTLYRINGENYFFPSPFPSTSEVYINN
jgi:hypothetical protein